MKHLKSHKLFLLFISFSFIFISWRLITLQAISFLRLKRHALIRKLL